MSSNPEFLTTNEAAKLLRLTPVTLRNWRAASEGPPWVRIGPVAVRYSRARLMEYVERFEQGDIREQPPKRGRPKGSKNKPTLKRLKANLLRVLTRHHLTTADLRLVMGAFAIERLRDLPTDRHADFVATLVALGERYREIAGHVPRAKPRKQKRSSTEVRGVSKALRVARKQKRSITPKTEDA